MTPPAMKLALFWFVLLFAPLSVARDSVAAPAPKPAPVAPALLVTAKVVELPKQIIYCGHIAYRAVVRYQVISVERGTLTAKEIFVVELCPETIKVGQTRKLKLRSATKRDSYVDEFKASTVPRWVNAPA